MKEQKCNQHVDQEHVMEEDGFVQGEAYPNCDGEPCANVAEENTDSDNGTEKLAVEAAEWRDKYIRLSAEFDNYRKRTLREKMELVSSASEDVIKALLPVIDDFDRAIDAMEKSDDTDAVREGVLLISSKLRDTLRSKGVTEIESLGKALDTDLHDAVAKVAGPKSHKGKIVDVMQKGYKLNDKVIRYAKVVVGE